jgi:hypothetical protein
MVMNLTLSKYYIYTERGILVNRVEFSDLVEKYGRPSLTSTDGLKFIFRRIDTNVNNKLMDLRNQIITIFEIDEYKIKYIK